VDEVMVVVKAKVAVAAFKAVVAATKTPTSKTHPSSFVRSAKRGVMKPLIAGTVMMKTTSRR
jgi:hypothetical protein